MKSFKDGRNICSDLQFPQYPKIGIASTIPISSVIHTHLRSICEDLESKHAQFSSHFTFLQTFHCTLFSLFTAGHLPEQFDITEQEVIEKVKRILFKYSNKLIFLKFSQFEIEKGGNISISLQATDTESAKDIAFLRNQISLASGVPQGEDKLHIIIAYPHKQLENNESIKHEIRMITSRQKAKLEAYCASIVLHAPQFQFFSSKGYMTSSPLFHVNRYVQFPQIYVLYFPTRQTSKQIIQKTVELMSQSPSCNHIIVVCNEELKDSIELLLEENKVNTIVAGYISNLNMYESMTNANEMICDLRKHNQSKAHVNLISESTCATEIALYATRIFKFQPCEIIIVPCSTSQLLEHRNNAVEIVESSLTQQKFSLHELISSNASLVSIHDKITIMDHPDEELNEHKITPLMTAILCRRMDVIQLLLSYGADYNYCSPQGVTPMHIASWLCNLQITTVLVQQGALLPSFEATSQLWGKPQTSVQILESKREFLKPPDFLSMYLTIHSPVKHPVLKTVLFIRHSQSAANTGEHLGIDPPLSTTGEQWCKSVAQQLEKIDFHVDLVFSSPLSRAIETARFVFAKQLKSVPHLIDARMREQLTTPGEIGLHSSELAKQYPHLEFGHLPEQWWFLSENNSHELIVDIEPLEQVRNRATQFFDHLATLPFKRAVCITHDDVMCAMFGRNFSNLGLYEMRL